jgi:hypothetical protein
MRRKRPLIRFPCCEIVPSASNLLITIAVSISSTSLSLIIGFDKAATLPPRQGQVSQELLLAYPSAGITEAFGFVICGIHDRPPLGNMVAP